jgi:hypothetical protein
MLGGSFRLAPINAPLLLTLLPRMIHIRLAEGDTGRLARVIGLVMEECTADRLGRELGLERLLEIVNASTSPPCPPRTVRTPRSERRHGSAG